MGNSASSNISRVYPTVERTTFFPGNLVRGLVSISCTDEVEYNCLSINLVGQLTQSFLVADHTRNNHQRGGGATLAALTGDTSHMVRRTVDLNLGEVGCTIIGSATTTKNSYRLQKGDHCYEWAFMLPPVLLPSANASRTSSGGFGERKSGDETVSIRYFVTAEISVAGKSAKQGSIPIMILFPIGISMWNRPSAVARSVAMDLTACFCCSRGKVSCNAGLAKSIIALDADQIQFNVEVDGTQSEDPIENMRVSLIATVNVKQGQRPIRFMNVIFSELKRCAVPAGQKKNVTGALQLGANRPPTIQSSVIDINYEVVFEFDFGLAENTKASIPIFVAHSVDMTDAATMLQQMHQNILSGKQQVPNLLNPLYSQFRPACLQDASLYQHHQMQMQQPQPQFAAPPQYQQQQQQQQPMMMYQQPEQYTQSNFAGDQQFSPQPYQQFGGIAAFPNQNLSQQAQQGY